MNLKRDLSTCSNIGSTYDPCLNAENDNLCGTCKGLVNLLNLQNYYLLQKTADFSFAVLFKFCVCIESVP